MLLIHRCLARISRPSVCLSQWHRIVRRRYATKPGDPEWFQKLRKEMLERKLPPLHDKPTESQEDALATALSPYLPYGFEPRLGTATLKEGTAPPHSIGNHFVYFNPKIAPDELLPDGTDSLHNPGHPFVRRMWAGGSVEVNLASYFQPLQARGWALDRPLTCVERIKEVTLRYPGAKLENILVTIERRYEKTSAVQHSTGVAEGKGPSDTPQISEQHMRPEEEWGDAILIEERNLVFMREISRARLEAINNGEVETKYLKAPAKKVTLSHTMTPTRKLLSRFSSLTSNAHAIHLDPDYCRTVEGHRNLLVHGPLTAMLLLKFLGSHLDRMSGTQRVIRLFKYRNLVPLYCDEELRLCASRKDVPRQRDGDITFDVWIEGPTGGTAVMGTIVVGWSPKVIDPTARVPGSLYTRPISKERAFFPDDKTTLALQQHTKQTVEQLDCERDATPSVLPETLIARETHMEQSGLIRKYHAAVDVEEEKAQQAELRSRFLKRGVKRILPEHPVIRPMWSGKGRRTSSRPSLEKSFA